MASKTLEDVTTLYESYFLRDLTYILSGAISVFAISLPFNSSANAILGILESHALLLVGAFGIFYVVGLILQEGLSAIHVFRVQPNIPAPYKTRHALLAEIRQSFGPTAIRELERTIYLKHVGCTIGSAAMLVAVFSFIAGLTRDPVLFVGIAIGAPIFANSLYLNRSKLEEQNRALDEFAAKLGRRNTNAG